MAFSDKNNDMLVTLCIGYSLVPNATDTRVVYIERWIKFSLPIDATVPRQAKLGSVFKINHTCETLICGNLWYLKPVLMTHSIIFQ